MELFGEGGRCFVVQRRVGPDGVVVFSLGLNDLAGFVDACKPVLIETFIPEFAVERFHIGILCRLAGLDKPELHPGFLRPFKHRPGSQFRAVVMNQFVRLVMDHSQMMKISAEQFSGDREVDNLAGTAPCAIIDDIQDPEPTSVPHAIRNEVQRPALVGANGCRQGNAIPMRQPFAFATTHLKSFFTIQTIGSLGIGHETFLAQKDMQSPIAIAAILTRQRLET